MNKLELMPLEETVKWAKHNSWYVADVLARRGTEGANPLIPRAEYEMLSFQTTFLQHPALYRWIGEKVGMEGIRATCSSGHREFGIKTITPCDIQWGCGIALFGRLFLVNGGFIGPNDYLDNLRVIYSFWKTVFEGYMRQKKPAVMDLGYVLQVLDQDVVEDVGEKVESLRDPDLRATVGQFNSLVQLMGFLDHYDNRTGLGDTGPYDLGDRLMIVRDCFVNEKAFPWTYVVGDLPFSYTLVLTYDKKKMMRDRKSGKLKMFSMYNTGTIFCDPGDYEDEALLEVAVYMRDEDYPRGKSTRIPLSELETHIQKLEGAVERMYQYLAMKPKFDKILEGNWTYVAASLPYVRAHDLEAEATEMGFWEMETRSMEYFLKGYDKAAEVQRNSTAGLGAPPPQLPGFRCRGTKAGRYEINN